VHPAAPLDQIKIPGLGECRRPASNQQDAGKRRTVGRTACRQRSCGVVGNWRCQGQGRREGQRSVRACSVGGSVLWGLEERRRPEAGAGGEHGARSRLARMHRVHRCHGVREIGAAAAAS
jgi:hypothetical protein